MLKRSPALALGLSLLSIGATADAADRWVDIVNGSDQGPQSDCLTQSAPCRTLGHAIAVLGLRPGDRIFAAPGVYASTAGERFPLNVPAGVTIESTDGPALTTLRPGGGADSWTVRLTFDGTTARPYGIAGFTLDGGGSSQNQYGVMVESVGAELVGAPAPYVRDCAFRGYLSASVLLVTWTSARSESFLGALVERNIATGAGFAVYTIADVGQLPALDRSILRNNVIIGAPLGIEIAALPTSAPTGLGRLETSLRHNTVLGASQDALYLSAEDERLPGAKALAIEVANNVFARSAGYGIREELGHAGADVTGFWANLVWGNALGGYFDADTQASYDSALELDAIPDLAGASASNLSQDPLLNLLDGRPQGASPVRDAGLQAYSALDDFDGRPRGTPPDIGAYEVAALRRGGFMQLQPLSPPRSQVLPNLPEYIAAPPSPFADPEPGVLFGLLPLLCYELEGAELKLVKSASQQSLLIHY